MRKILYPFIFLGIIGISVYVMQKCGIRLPVFVNNHLNDLLIVPINLFAVQMLWGILNGTTVFLRFSIVASSVLFYSIFFEFILPQFNSRYTADGWDVLCYVAGGVLFYLYQHVAISKQGDNI